MRTKMRYWSGISLLLLLAVLVHPMEAQSTSTSRSLAPSKSFLDCLRSISSGKAKVVTPLDGQYDQARRVMVATSLQNPAAVFYAYNTAQVSAAVKCANAAGVKVTPACGRQGFTGKSVQNGYLSVDITNIKQKSVAEDRKSVTVGAGNNAAMLQAWLNDTGLAGMGLPSGTCTWVGVSGFLLGGGLGPMGRLAGLGCDSVLKLEIVLANGTVVNASKDKHSDLFWASCGSGGGNFGIVTAFTLKLVTLPNKGRITAIGLTYKGGAAATIKEFMNFQKWLPKMDRRFGLDTLNLGIGIGGPQFGLGGVFFGTADEALKLLAAAGMLNSNLDNSSSINTFWNEVADKYPYSGLRVKSLGSMYEWYFLTAPDWTGNENAAYSYSGIPESWAANGFTYTPEEMEFLYKLMRAQNGQVVGGSGGYSAGLVQIQARLTALQPEGNVKAIVQYIEEAQKACTNGSNPGLCFIFVGNHVLGGAYMDRANNATAFPWRRRYLLLGSGIGLPVALLGGTTPEAIKSTTAYIDKFPSLLWDADAAYVNYQAPTLSNWQKLYFGTNYARLQSMKKAYDPRNLFGKPYTVEIPA